MRACWRCSNLAACVTGIMLDLSPTPRPTAGGCASSPVRPKARPSAARSVMSSPFRSAGIIIARSIAAAMKQHGGKILVSIRRLQPDPFGSKATRDRWVRRKQQPTYDCNPTRIELRPRPDRARFRNRHRQSGGGSTRADARDFADSVAGRWRSRREWRCCRRDRARAPRCHGRRG
jgi:hypothetical protein